jgi:multisubunit Na+/H+ antiporter MnhB subunit
MTASIALNSFQDIDSNPAPSKGLGRFASNFLKRVRQVGESLRHPTPETIAFVKSAAFVGLSIGAGIGAKAGALALFGVATGGAGLAAAVIGGAAVGLSKAAVKHLKERNQEGGSKFLSLLTLKTAGISAAISTATLGYSELFEHFTGETVTHALGKAFHKVAGTVSEKLFDLMPGGNLHAQTLDNVPRPMAIVPEAPTTAPVADIVQDNVPKPMSVTPAPVVDTVQDNIPKPMAITEPTAPVAEPVPRVAPQKAVLLNDRMAVGQHPTLDNSIREKAIAWVHRFDSLPKAVPATHVAEITPNNIPPNNIPVPATPTQDLAAQAIAKAKLAVAQEDLTNHYTTEHLRQLVKGTTGIDAPEDVTAEVMAKQLNANNPEAFLKAIQQQAPQIKVENLAASCTTEIPKERSSVNVIKTLCYKFKEHMSGNDVAVVDNSSEADPKKGLRLLYRKAMGAIGGAAQVQSTNSFIAENISGPNGVVQEMTEAKLGL